MQISKLKGDMQYKSLFLIHLSFFYIIQSDGQKTVSNQRGFPRFDLQKSEPFVNPLLHKNNPREITKCLRKSK